MKDCVFCRISRGEIPKEFTYQDDEIMVFPDIHPVAPTHLLVVPKAHIEDFQKLSDDAILSSVRRAIQDLVRKNKLEDKGFKIIVNSGGAQIINHLHFHLIGPVGHAVEI